MKDPQGRLGELGWEMLKIAMVPNNLSTGCKAQSATVSMSVAPHVPHSHPTSSIAMNLAGLLSGPNTPIHHPRLSSTTASESTSPPITLKRRELGTRLPYPAGDYTSPPDTFSPSNSLPSSISLAMRPLSMAVLGYPSIHCQDWVYYWVFHILLPHFRHCLLLEWIGCHPHLLNPSLSLPLSL